MNEYVVTIIAALLGSGAFTAIVNIAFNLLKEKRDKDKGVSAGVRIILYDRIRWFGKKYLEAGYVTPDDLEDLMAMHRIYHDELHGNGYLDTLMDSVKRLPPKK